MIRFVAACLAAMLAVGGERARITNPQSRLPTTRPNILMIVANDQASWSLGSYRNTDARAPVPARALKCEIGKLKFPISIRLDRRDGVDHRVATCRRLTCRTVSDDSLRFAHGFELT
jgi:hypothetical protein